MKIFFKSILLLVLILAVCINNKSNAIIPGSNTQTVHPKTHHMFVFIHGTILLYPSPDSLISSIKTTLKNKNRQRIHWHDQFIHDLRCKSIYKFQPIQEYGLHPINFAPITINSPYYYSFVSATLFQKMLNSVDSEEYTNTSYYTFGWDGELSNESRIQNGKILYQSLVDEVEKLKKIHSNLSVTIIGHSHGGNVALNMAKAYEELKSNLLIDKLILVGTPVQSETSKFVSCPIFKQIYSFYSNSDIIQVADILSTKDLGSKRRFKNIIPLKNLVQVELMVGSKSPTHDELWLFGDKANWLYRHKLVTYPLPLFLFFPKILYFLENTLPNANDLFVKIDKQDQDFSISIKDKNQRESASTTSAFPTNLLTY